MNICVTYAGLSIGFIPAHQVSIHHAHQQHAPLGTYSSGEFTVPAFRTVAEFGQLLRFCYAV
jgi:hypothetical protein